MKVWHVMVEELEGGRFCIESSLFIDGDKEMAGPHFVIPRILLPQALRVLATLLPVAVVFGVE